MHVLLLFNCNVGLHDLHNPDGDEQELQFC